MNETAQRTLLGIFLALLLIGSCEPRPIRYTEFGPGVELWSDGRVVRVLDAAGAQTARYRLSQHGARLFDASSVRTGRLRPGAGAWVLEDRAGADLCRVAASPGSCAITCGPETLTVVADDSHVQLTRTGGSFIELLPSVVPADWTLDQGTWSVVSAQPARSARAAAGGAELFGPDGALELRFTGRTPPAAALAWATLARPAPGQPTSAFGEAEAAAALWCLSRH